MKHELTLPFFQKHKLMYKNFGGSFNCPVCLHPGCGPDSIYTRIKSCEKQK